MIEVGIWPIIEVQLGDVSFGKGITVSTGNSLYMNPRILMDSDWLEKNKPNAGDFLLVRRNNSDNEYALLRANELQQLFERSNDG